MSFTMQNYKKYFNVANDINIFLIIVCFILNYRSSFPPLISVVLLPVFMDQQQIFGDREEGSMSGPLTETDHVITMPAFPHQFAPALLIDILQGRRSDRACSYTVADLAYLGIGALPFAQFGFGCIGKLFFVTKNLVMSKKSCTFAA